MIKNWILKMLASFDYDSGRAFFESCAPSIKYSLTRGLLMISGGIPIVGYAQAFFTGIPVALGIQIAAFISLMLAFVVELISGLVASFIKKEQFSSFRLSRFGLKVVIYFALIAFPFQWSQNFSAKHDAVMASAFDWMQNFLIVHIFLENMVSILENLSVIDGKDKTAWINTIKAKLFQ